MTMPVARAPHPALAAWSALRAQASGRGALVTLVRADGGSSKPVGAHLALAEDGRAYGSVTIGGCADGRALAVAGRRPSLRAFASASRCRSARTTRSRSDSAAPATWSCSSSGGVRRGGSAARVAGGRRLGARAWRARRARHAARHGVRPAVRGGGRRASRWHGQTRRAIAAAAALAGAALRDGDAAVGCAKRVDEQWLVAAAHAGAHGAHRWRDGNRRGALSADGATGLALRADRSARRAARGAAVRVGHANATRRCRPSWCRRDWAARARRWCSWRTTTRWSCRCCASRCARDAVRRACWAVASVAPPCERCWRRTGSVRRSSNALRTPIGLSIGAQGAAEIAVSIVAELIAIWRGVT